MEDDLDYLITEEEMFENLKVSNVMLIQNYANFGEYEKIKEDSPLLLLSKTFEDKDQNAT